MEKNVNASHELGVTFWRILQNALNQDVEGQKVLKRFQADPDGTAEALTEWLLNHHATVPPQLATYVSGGQVDKLINIAHAGVVFIQQTETPHKYIRTFPYQRNDFFTEQERSDRLIPWLNDPPAFIKERLSLFVGREKERAEINQHIATLQNTGGFLIITGPAGQGKSSIIAKLVESIQGEQAIYHFIPYTRGGQPQVNLLQNVIARLLLKHQDMDDDIDFTNATYPALQHHFHFLLKRIAERGQKELLFIDGLDQLERENTDWRDLTFLPTNPPPGIVFILGTRPDDTLKPLKLVKPCILYPLPKMNLTDFQLLLQLHGLKLEPNLIGLYHQVLGGHAFYLDLAGRILAEKGHLAPHELISQIESNPDNLLWLSLERVKHPLDTWKFVIKPILGVLLETREPLNVNALSQIIDVDEDRLFDGLTRLGGLVIQDGQQRWTLFHLKLYAYLRTDEHKRLSVFSPSEERHWHKALADWCEQDMLTRIWEDSKDHTEQERRVYARQYYIVHIYSAQQWQHLFTVLDEGKYGRAKIRNDNPGMHSYIDDLDLGRRAIVEMEEIQSRLPQFWRYTFLRASLVSRADRYPVEAFGLLVLLGRQHEALGLAALVTDPSKQVEIFYKIADLLKKQGASRKEQLRILRRAIEVVKSASDRPVEDAILMKLGEELTEYEEWEGAMTACRMIVDGKQQVETWSNLGQSLAQANQWEYAGHVWEEAEKAVARIAEREEQVEALDMLGQSLAQVDRLSDAQRVWQEAENIIDEIDDRSRRRAALDERGKWLSQAGQWGYAQHLWQEAENVTDFVVDENQREESLHLSGPEIIQTDEHGESVEVTDVQSDDDHRNKSFSAIDLPLLEIDTWEDANRVINLITDKERRDTVLLMIAQMFIEKNKWQEAKLASNMIAGREKQAEVLAMLGLALIQVNEWEEVIQVHRQILFEELRDSVLAASLDAFCRADSLKHAEQIGQAIWMMYGNNHLIPLREKKAIMDFFNVLDRVVSLLGWERFQNVWQQTMQNIGKSDFDAFALFQRLDKGKGGWKRFFEGGWEKFQLLSRDFRYVSRMFENEMQRAEVLGLQGQILIQLDMGEHAQQFWEEAEQECGTISDKKRQAVAWCRLGQMLIEAGNHERAQKVWQEIERACAEAFDEQQRIKAFCTLIQTLAEAGDHEHVQDILREIKQMCAHLSDETQRAEALSMLGQALVQAQVLDEAERVCDLIPRKEQRSGVLSLLGRRLIQAQAWDEAERICSLIPYKKHRSETLSWLGEALAQVNAWSEAERIYRLIPDQEQQLKALCSLVEALVQVHAWAEAERICGLISEKKQRNVALSILTRALIQAQNLAEAERICGLISEKKQLIEMLCVFGQVLVQAKDQDYAQQIWDETKHVCDQIFNKKQHVEALCTFGQALNQAGSQERAQQIWDETRRICRLIAKRKQRVEALALLWQTLSRVGEEEKAKRVILAAEQICNLIVDKWQRVEALSILGAVLVQANKYEHARKIWQEAEQVCNLISGHQQHIGALTVLGQTLIQVREWEAAERVCQMISEKERRSEILTALGLALIKAGKWEAIQIDGEFKYLEISTHQLQTLGDSLADQGMYEGLLILIQRSWLDVETLAHALQVFALAGKFFVLQPALGFACYEGFHWVDRFFTQK